MEISSYLKKAADDIKKTAGSLVEKAENAHNKYKTEAELDEMYLTLGKIRYEELCGSDEAIEESRKLAAEITRLKEELRRYQKASKNVRACEWCGETVQKDAAFCPYCGYKF